MRLTLAHIGARLPAGDDFDRLTSWYLKRSGAYFPCEPASFRSEDAFLEWLERRHGRTPALTVLLDSHGRPMTSEAFASWIGARRDGGAQHIVFAIGPADGWSDAAKLQAQLVLSLSPFTFAHSLARLVLAEQIYRACTILAGHPYHTGH